MTNDEIDEIWNQHIRIRKDMDLHVFAQAIAAAQREASAKLADSFYGLIRQYTTDVPDIGAAIRERSNNESNRLAATNISEGDRS